MQRNGSFQSKWKKSCESTVQYCSTLISIINYNVLLLQIPGNEMAVFYLVEDSSTLISFLIGKKEPILIKKKKGMNWRHAGATISITESS